MRSVPGAEVRADVSAIIDERQFTRALGRAVGAPLLAMTVLIAVFLGLIGLLLDSTSWVEHTDQVIAQAHQLEKLFIDRETGLRGYALTGDPLFLEPYNAAQTTIPPTLMRLNALVADNPPQLERLRALAQQREAWEKVAQDVIARTRSGDLSQSVATAGVGKQHMDAIRAVFAALIETETALRTERTATTRQTTLLVAGGSLLLALVLGGLLAWGTRLQLLNLAGQYGTALAATERSAARLRALHAIDQAILSRTPFVATVHAALQRLLPLLDLRRAVALVTPPDAAGLVQLVIDPANSTSEPVPADAQSLPPLAEILGDRPVALDELPLAAAHLCEPLRAADLTHALLVALRNNGTLGGVIAIGVPAGTRLAQDETMLVREVTDQLSIALQQEQLHQAVTRQTVELEQRVAARTEQLTAANAELEAFGYSVAHDLRAPIRAMQSFAAALAEDYGEQLDDLGREYAQRIVTAGERMEGLINDLLTYSRLSRAELSFSRVALAQAVQDALTQRAEDIARCGAQIAVIQPLPVVIGHRTTLVQVLANLFANALTFVTAGVTPQLTLRAISSAGWATVELQDNGIGIAPEHQERIFRIFERLHGIEHYPGTGVGLAIVRKGVQRMGGQVGVQSQLGAGSTFWFRLPLTGGMYDTCHTDSVDR